MTQLSYTDGPKLLRAGMPFRSGYKALTVVNNTRVHQVDQGTLVANLNDEVGVTIEGISVTVISSGTAADDATALAAAINAETNLIGVVEKAEAVGDDIFVTYFDYLTHAVMVAVSPGIADVTPIVIATAASSGENFAFGVGLVTDANDTTGQSVRLPAAAGDVDFFAGASMFNHLAMGYDLPLNEAVPSGNELGVLYRGFIPVRINSAVTIGDDVYLQHTLNGTNAPGEFRNDTDGGNAAQITSGARWYRAGTLASGLAVLELNLVG